MRVTYLTAKQRRDMQAALADLSQTLDMPDAIFDADHLRVLITLAQVLGMHTLEQRFREALERLL